MWGKLYAVGSRQFVGQPSRPDEGLVLRPWAEGWLTIFLFNLLGKKLASDNLLPFEHSSNFLEYCAYLALGESYLTQTGDV